jgi:hypothetical protein
MQNQTRNNGGACFLYRLYKMLYAKYSTKCCMQNPTYSNPASYLLFSLFISETKRKEEKIDKRCSPLVVGGTQEDLGVEFSACVSRIHHLIISKIKNQKTNKQYQAKKYPVD